ncbi:hypothetical protein CYY_001589 [Polysphondylium violaceum]|uniref:Maltase n=1 Tax=Polysphondylium violaceum TaxID=133409 RepID=A0A8J4Q1K3_9MYCE|nr:hypothetical protein CYY_001589 [Polysphondylium violaceum]
MMKYSLFLSVFLLVGVIFIGSLNVNASCPAFPGYNVTNYQRYPNDIVVELSLLSPGPYGNDIQNAVVHLSFVNAEVLRVRILDADNQRWEISDIINKLVPSNEPFNSLYETKVHAADPFSFAVIRISDGSVLFNTSPTDENGNCLFNGLIFSDYYIELSTQFESPNPNLYGLGERTTQLRLLNNYTYTIFNKDEGTASTPNINTYGSHPFYMNLDSKTGNAHGVLLLNSNAMDIVIQPQSLTYKVTGGILDLFFFMGPSPLQVIQQYTSVVGKPHMPSYWSLGWHQCRWGYRTLQDTMDVVSNYTYYNIPLETIWNDIDYMDDYKDFTSDPERFPPDQYGAFVDSLHANNQHYMMIVDPGISNATGYQSYEDLISSGGYIRDAADGVSPVIGMVWPGFTAFPDFFNPDGVSFWQQQLQNWYNVVKFDGIWIDMNEISNFCSGNCWNIDPAPQPGFDPNFPPYIPGGIQLSDRTINMSSIQSTAYGDVLHYNIHNLYGYSEGVATRRALENIQGTRSTIISRSTFAGAGYHYSHWLGDNKSTYQDLYYSIPGILLMNMFGVPLVGADIGGFNGNSNGPLLARWMQLGNFYPFSRNHNTYNGVPQEPYVFGEQVMNISIAAINMKYTLLPYYYTLFHFAHTQGNPVVRPLFFEYSNDENTVAIDQQFLLGSHIMVSPVLVEDAVTVNAYFPDDTWYDFFSGELMTYSGQNATLDAPLEVIPVHLRAGAIIPTQPTYNYEKPANGVPITTTIARTLPFELIVSLDQGIYAYGQLYLDDGISLDTYENGFYSLIEFELTSDSVTFKLSSTIDTNGYDASHLNIGSIKVYGATSLPSNVVVNGQSITTYQFNNYLLIENLEIPLSETFEIDWS